MHGKAKEGLTNENGDRNTADRFDDYEPISNWRGRESKLIMTKIVFGMIVECKYRLTEVKYALFANKSE